MKQDKNNDVNSNVPKDDKVEYAIKEEGEGIIKYSFTNDDNDKKENDEKYQEKERGDYDFSDFVFKVPMRNKNCINRPLLNRKRNNIFAFDDSKDEKEMKAKDNGKILFDIEKEKMINKHEQIMTEYFSCPFLCCWCSSIIKSLFSYKIKSCGHILCLKCAEPLLHDKGTVPCPLCKNEFSEKDLAYTRITQAYISLISEKPSLHLKQEKEIIKKEKKKDIIINCVLTPEKNQEDSEDYLPEIKPPHNEFNVNVSRNPDIVKVIKKNILSYFLNQDNNAIENLSMKDIEVRFLGINVSYIDNYETLFDLGLECDCKNTFEYCRA